MIPVRQAAAAVTTGGGCAALAMAAIMLAACGGQPSAAPATTSPAASSASVHSSGSAAAAASSVQLPAQLLGLNRNTSATAKQAVTIVSKEFASRLTGDVVGGKAAIYGGAQNGATPFFFVTAGTWAKHVASLNKVAHSLQAFMRTKGFTDARVLPARPNGEALVCGQKHVTAGTDTICYWADLGTFGAVLYSPGFVSGISDAASKTSKIRSAVVS